MKYLDIDPQGVQSRLADLGAVKTSDGLIRQKVYDYPDSRLNKEGAWVRIRDHRGKVTLAFKKRLGIREGKKGNDKGMEEVEVEVSDFEKTAMIFEGIGMKLKFYREKRRETYETDGVEIAIDYWPLIPPYLEIEGHGWKELNNMARDLGLNPAKKKIISAMQVFEAYGVKEMDYEVLTFDQQTKRK